MGKASSPSDFTNIDVNYNIGFGYYTTHTDISNLLQISAFTDSTTPTRAEVGKIIKRVEDKIDDKVGHPFRPIIYKDEVHNFEFFRHAQYPVQPYKDYVGFIQLERPKILKIVRLEVWQGNSYVDLASATASYSPPATGSGYNLTLGVGNFSFVLTEGTHFFGSYGKKTTASQVVDAINEVFPQKTAQFTGEVAPKSRTATSGGLTRNVSDFFYASTDTEDSSKVIISSLLPGDDGSDCTITASAGSKTNFTDNQDQRRLGDYWTIDSEGKIFFLRNYPYVQNHSCKVTYVSGDSRVPGVIHDAATKLVAAEIIRHDDNSILIAETGSNIDLKTKHDILVKEAMETLNGKKIVIYSL
tara:strand:- start:15258 stop:16328 length:1071 start_codon:yes stop_codon:yes gene_type:complete